MLAGPNAARAVVDRVLEGCELATDPHDAASLISAHMERESDEAGER